VPKSVTFEFFQILSVSLGHYLNGFAGALKQLPRGPQFPHAHSLRREGAEAFTLELATCAPPADVVANAALVEHEPRS